FPLEVVTDGHLSEYGLGHVLLSAASERIELAPLVDPNQQHQLAVSPMGHVYAYRGRYARYSPEYDAPVDALLPQATAPMGTFLVIISLFTLLIGPGSIWVAKKRGPGALLVTIPGTALVSCALIVSSSILKDGFSIHASAQGYTEIDSRR